MTMTTKASEKAYWKSVDEIGPEYGPVKCAPEPCYSRREREYRDLRPCQVDPEALCGGRTSPHGSEEAAEGAPLDEDDADHADPEDDRRENEEVPVARVARKEIDRADLRAGYQDSGLAVARPREREEQLIAEQRERECEQGQSEAGDPYRDQRDDSSEQRPRESHRPPPP